MGTGECPHAYGWKNFTPSILTYVCKVRVTHFVSRRMKMHKYVAFSWANSWARYKFYIRLD